MKHWMFGLTFAIAALAAAAAAQAQTCEEEKYDTAVSWVRDGDKAAEKARAEKRLLMVVHLAGELDDANRT